MRFCWAILLVIAWRFAAATEPQQFLLVTVQPAHVELVYPIVRSHSFAFSPDATSLAFARSKMLEIKQIGDVVHDAPIPIDELVMLKLDDVASPQTLVSADVTKQFAVYGTSLFDIRWQDNHIRFIASNGDDYAYELDYMVAERRLADNQGKDVSEEVDPVEEALRQSLLGCFAELPEFVVSSGFMQYLLGSEYAIFQVRVRDYPDDIWLVHPSTCNRTRINVDLPAAGKKTSLANAFLSQGTLSLVMSESLPQFDQLLIWQTQLTELLAQKNPPEWREWTGITAGYFHARLIGTALSHPLLLLESTSGDCGDMLLNVGSDRIEQVHVDSNVLCDATVHPDGKLALSVYRYRFVNELKEQFTELRANELLVISPEFAKSLSH